jgi:hypothetical protein
LPIAAGVSTSGGMSNIMSGAHEICQDQKYVRIS